GSVRARRFVLVAAAALGGVALLPSPASAGGGWSTPGRSAYEPADVAIIQGSFGGGATAAESIADGPYVAYLLPANRWIHRGRLPKAAIPVGEVMITRTDLDGFLARVAFRVPDLPAGLYHIQYCNDPCTVYWIDDLMGSESFAIGATLAEGRLLMLADHLRSRIDEVTYRLRRQAAAQVRGVERELSAALGLQAIAEVRGRELTETLRTTRTALEAERSTVATAFVIGSGLVLIAIALLVMLLATTRRLRAARLDAELQAMRHIPTSVDSTS
ncbi:MAG: hypothetical protein ACRDGO_03360, partial [Actinomycetota bacterium]